MEVGLLFCGVKSMFSGLHLELESSPKGRWGRGGLRRSEQRDICPGLEGFHASGRPDDLGPAGLPAERGSQRVNLTQMDPHVHTEHTHTQGRMCERTHVRVQTDVRVDMEEHKHVR